MRAIDFTLEINDFVDFFQYLGEMQWVNQCGNIDYTPEAPDKHDYFEAKLGYALMNGGTVTLEVEDPDGDEGEFGKFVELTLDDFNRALKQIAETRPDICGRLMDPCEADIWDYDCLLQMAVYGEVIFG